MGGYGKFLVYYSSSISLIAKLVDVSRNMAELSVNVLML